MPLRKFRSLQDMEDSLWYPPGEPALWAAIRRVWDFASRAAPRRFPPGVYRHRGIEAAQALRDTWDEENFREFWRRQYADQQAAAAIRTAAPDPPVPGRR